MTRAPKIGALSETDGHRGTLRNRLLASLSAEEREPVLPFLERVALRKRKQLEYPNRPIEHVYFPESGIASVVVASGPDGPVEVGIIGHEGLTGIALVHQAGRSPYSTFIQIECLAHRIAADAFEEAVRRSAALRAAVQRAAHVFLMQVSQTAIANARASIEERLARWLLMAQDRVPQRELPLTHEFLSLMIGIRRPGVTEAVHALSARGLIRGGRGIIEILDRGGLERRAGRFYGLPERECARLFAPLSG